MSVHRVLISVVFLVLWSSRVCASTSVDYEADLRVLFGRVLSMVAADSVQFTVPKSATSSEITISGVSTMYVFASSQVLIVRSMDGGFTGAVVTFKTEVDEGLKDKVEEMFRSREAPASIQFRLSSDRRRIFAFCDDLRGKTEEKKTANQALQTTPMTRSGSEKTIEFGHPQRGV